MGRQIGAAHDAQAKALGVDLFAGGLGHAGDDVLHTEQLARDLRYHQIDVVILGDGGHGVAGLNARTTQYIAVDGHARHGHAGKWRLQFIEQSQIGGVFVQHGNIVPQPLQHMYQPAAHAAAAYDQDIHSLSPSVSAGTEPGGPRRADNGAAVRRRSALIIPVPRRGCNRYTFMLCSFAAPVL